MKEDRVVVLVSPEYLHDMDNNRYVVQFRQLGFGAYGSTPDEAFSNAKRVLADQIAVHRKNKTLSRWLTECGVEWDYELNYHGDLEVEDISGRKRDL